MGSGTEGIFESESGMSHQEYYTHNKVYTEFLRSHTSDQYAKYVHWIVTLAQKSKKDSARFLDVGCGTGQVLEALKKNKKVFAQGIEVSATSVQLAAKKRLRCRVYDGETIPSADGSFFIVGSFNVLEHTNDPRRFLSECLRVLEERGFLIVVCPNFLSITNNYHHHTRGWYRKLLNIATLIRVFATSNDNFPVMQPIVRDVFQPDDDALNATNPLSLLSWARKRNLKLVHWSSQQQERKSGLISQLDRGICRVGLGSVFMVFRKYS